MKVYATKVNDGQVILIEWTSQKAFERNQSWIDPKFIQVATTKDLDSYEFPYEKGMVVCGQDRIDGHNLLHSQFIKTH
jgi:hypothetical protein